MRVNQPQGNRNARAVLIGGSLVFLVGIFFSVRAFWDKTPEDVPVVQDSVDSEDPAKDIPLITAAVVRQKILNNEHVVLLDVRDQESYVGEHIPQSLLTSPSALNSYSADPNTIVVIVFSERDRERKEAVSNILRQKSYRAFLLQGGIEEWKRSGNQTLSSGDPNSFLDQSKITYLAPPQALEFIQGTPTPYILDIQSEADYQKKHLKGAVNIPLSQLEKRFREIPPGKNILVYGESELASFQGGVRLSDLNIFTAKTLSGNDHLKAGSPLPLEP